MTHIIPASLRTGVASLAGVAAVLSNLISNVPAVLLFHPLIPHFPDPQRAWLTLAMATTWPKRLNSAVFTSRLVNTGEPERPSQG